MSSHGEQNLIEGNPQYAEEFTQGNLALPPAQNYAICRRGHTP
jgi:carbonic anhydrase